MYTTTFSYMLWSLFFITIQATDAPHFEPHFTNKPNFNPTFTPTFHAENKPHIVINTMLSVETFITIKQTTLLIIEKAQETITRENFDSAKKILQDLCWQYRYTIAGYTLLGSYSIAAALLLTDYHYLNNTMRWARWKPDYTFEVLCEMSQKELAQELVHAIGERNYNKKNPTDLAHPLIEFIAMIETEIKTCKRYLALAQCIKLLRLMTIFPTGDAKIGEITQLLERALFIKHIFLSWLAEYNVANTKKNKQSKK